jgi:hypothetical protein
MNLYLIKRIENAYWDENAAHVIRAKSNLDCRNIAADAHADEQEEAWSNQMAEITVLAENVQGPEGIVLTDFNAG